MTIISLPKSIEDIEIPDALPEDYYLMRIIEEPVVDSNKKKKEGGKDAPGAGDNLVLNLRVQSDNPEYNGRPFRKWLGLPNENDKTDILSDGMTKEDKKIAMLAKVEEGFTGVAPAEATIDLRAGMEAWCYITNGLDSSGNKFVNDLDFMQDIKPV